MKARSIHLLLAGSFLLAATALHAQPVIVGDYFGKSASVSGDNALVGANGENNEEGSAYYFKNLDTAIAVGNEAVKLTASDFGAGSNFGISVSLSGDNALVTAVSKNGSQGAAYYFKNLDGVVGNTTTEEFILKASDGEATDNFGDSVSLSGDNALIGATGDDEGQANSGSAYYFKGLNGVPAGNTTNENVKLTASDPASNGFFGNSVSLSGDKALVGANGNNSDRGAAYYFKNLDTAGSTQTEDVILTASDGAGGENFGWSVSLSGDKALVGDNGNAGFSGAAYYFRNLDSATIGSTQTEDVKLTASDAAAGDYFGASVSLSGDNALVGAEFKNGGQGAAYYFKNLEGGGSTATETVKITASDCAAGDRFGGSVSLDGDRFVVGANEKNSNAGGAYSGRISAITTLDVGNANRRIDGISVVSKDNWIVGENTDGNSVTLTAGDSATVNEAGKSVFIGRNAGSDNNTLVIEGTLNANDVFIGSTAGNTGNIFLVESTATLSLVNIYLAVDNWLTIAGDYSSDTDLLTFLAGANLQIENPSGNFQLADATNKGILWDATYDGTTYTNVFAVPEPATYALILGGLTLFGAILRKRFKRA